MEENIFSRCFLDATPFQHHFFPSCYLLIFELNRSLAYQLMVTCLRTSHTVVELRYQSSKQIVYVIQLSFDYGKIILLIGWLHIFQFISHKLKGLSRLG